MAWSLTRFRTPARADRKITFIKAYLMRGEKWIEVGIANASRTGVMVKCSAPPAEGAEIEIRRRGCAIYGRVVWVSGSRFGLASYDPIDVDALLAEAGSLGEACRASAPPRPNRYWQWQRPRAR